MAMIKQLHFCCKVTCYFPNLQVFAKKKCINISFVTQQFFRPCVAVAFLTAVSASALMCHFCRLFLFCNPRVPLSPSAIHLRAFLADVIGGWTVQDDQSSGTQSSDLQVAKYSSGFAMKHEMGLCSITLGTKSVYSKYTNYVNGDKTSGYSSATKDKTITASSNFSGSKRLQKYSGKYYYVIKSGTDTPFSTSALGITKWSAITANVASGNYTSYTAEVSWNKDYYSYVWMYSYKGTNSYTGERQNWNTSATGYGKYVMECWGASGGRSILDGTYYDTGGRGGYTYGEIVIESKNWYIFVGGQGQDSQYNASTKKATADSKGGWNGGGLGAYDRSDDDGSSAGGGATDIRTGISSGQAVGTWKDLYSLKSRIMVAGGGGGGACSLHHGGCGGNASGAGRGWWMQDGVKTYNNSTGHTPGSQTGGYRFGYGQDGSNGTGSTTADNSNITNAGGGGGYYGGANSSPYRIYTNPGQSSPGGSSFISGRSSCNAIRENCSVWTGGASNHTGSPDHFSGNVFTNDNMINGENTMPAPYGGTETGHYGNGYVRITFVPIED